MLCFQFWRCWCLQACQTYVFFCMQLTVWGVPALTNVCGALEVTTGCFMLCLRFCLPLLLLACACLCLLVLAFACFCLLVAPPPLSQMCPPSNTFMITFEKHCAQIVKSRNLRVLLASGRSIMNCYRIHL